MQKKMPTGTKVPSSNIHFFLLIRICKLLKILPAIQLVSDNHIIAYVAELYEMEGVLNNYKLGDKDKLEVYTGVAKVRKDLKVLQNKFRMVQNGAKYSSSSKKNNIGAWSPEKEEMKRSKRLEARAKRKKEDKKLAQGSDSESSKRES